MAKRTHVCFHMNQCNELPLRGKNADFWPVSKFNTSSLLLCGIFAGNNYVRSVEILFKNAISEYLFFKVNSF